MVSSQQNVLQTRNCQFENLKMGLESIKEFPNKKLSVWGQNQLNILQSRNCQYESLIMESESIKVPQTRNCQSGTMQTGSRVNKMFCRLDVVSLKLYKWGQSQQNVLQTRKCKPEAMKKGLELTKRFAGKICQFETLKMESEVPKCFPTNKLPETRKMGSESINILQTRNCQSETLKNGIRVNKIFCKQKIASLKLKMGSESTKQFADRKLSV